MSPSLLDELRSKLKTALDERAASEARIDEIVDECEARSDKNPTDAEAAEVTELRNKIAELDKNKTDLKARIDEAEARATARQEAEALARSLPTTTTTHAGGRNVSVRSEEKVYREGGEHSFFADLYARDMRRGNSRPAEERLARHEQETLVEMRASTISTMAGMVPPKYLVDEYAPFASAGRPFLNAVGSQTLPPDGVSYVIPRVSTGATAAIATEGSGFNDTDIAVSNDTAVVQLIGAKSDVSRTLVERGGPIVDRLVFPELLESCNRIEDSTALNGTNATTSILGPLSGVSGINSVAYTDASPTVGELWPKIADAIQRIESNRFAAPTAIFMHPRRWGWITSALDTQGRPLFNFSTVMRDDPYVGLGTGLVYGQIVGSLMGLPVITDASMPSTWSAGAPGAGTEDAILVARTPDFVLWEDAPMQFYFEQTPSTAPGQIRLAVGRFVFAHFARYPKSISVIGGTGLVAPTF